MEELKESVCAVQALELAFGYAPSLVAKAACELGIPDMLAEQPLSARDIAEKLRGDTATMGRSSSTTPTQQQQQVEGRTELVERMMRFLSVRGVFEARLVDTEGSSSTTVYAQTPLSTCLVQSGNPMSVRSMLLFQTSKEILAPWHHLSEAILQGGNVASFKMAHGTDVWGLASDNVAFSHSFNAAMSSSSYTSMHAFLAHYRGLEHEVHTLVDVGGGTGATASYIAARYPSIKVINFDLPHVVASAPLYPGVEHVGGDMFDAIPSGDSIFMKWILHDWGDEDCIKILKNCHKALPTHGKVIIMDAVLEGAPNTRKSLFNDFQVSMDMAMLVHTANGKERTREQWEHIFQASNFCDLRFYDIPFPQCVIEACPCCPTKI